MVITGRGGAGNIVADDEAMSTLVNADDNARERVQTDQAIRTPENDESKNDKKVYYSTGRGGAGNFHSLSQVPSPKLVLPGTNTPSITTNKFTTGRGGYGNMVENDDPKLTRKLQDVDTKPLPKENDLHAVGSNKSFLVGRGGFGNVISKTKSDGSTASNGGNNLYTVVSQGEKKAKSEKGWLHKLKSFFLL